MQTSIFWFLLGWGLYGAGGGITSVSISNICCQRHTPVHNVFYSKEVLFLIRYVSNTENAKLASKAIISSEFSNKYNRPLTRLTRAQKNTFFSNSYISEPKWPRYLNWVTYSRFLGELNSKPFFDQVTPSRSSGKSFGTDLPPPGLTRSKISWVK